MKGLPKSLRSRRRYLFFEVERYPDADFDKGDLQRAVWFSAQNLYGDLTSSEAELDLIEYSSEEGVGVLRCAHDRTREARAALACVDDVHGDKVGIKVLGISGTLKSGRSKYSNDVEKEKTSVDGREAWKQGVKLDVEREQKSKEGRDTKFIGATVHDF